MWSAIFGWLIVARVDVELVAPLLSAMVRITLKVPGVAKE